MPLVVRVRRGRGRLGFPRDYGEQHFAHGARDAALNGTVAASSRISTTNDPYTASPMEPTAVAGGSTASTTPRPKRLTKRPSR
jgi:hypothetical protein